MGYREYARHRGVNLFAVQKAIKAGRISVTADGRIDSEAADRQWAASTDAALQRGAQAVTVIEPAAPPLISGEPAVGPTILSRGLDGPEWPPRTEWPKPVRAGVVVDGSSFMAARTAREHAEAQLAELELAGKLGKVIDAAEAQKTFKLIARMHAQAREAVPTQLATKLVGKTDPREIEQTIRAAFREADARIADEIQARFSSVVFDAVVG